MKPYSTNPGEAKVAKYARKKKRIGTRVKVERQHKKAARVLKDVDTGWVDLPSGGRMRLKFTQVEW